MLAWHYTTGQNFIKIVNSGFLKPIDIDVRPPEKPILWFSLNQKWELTANKAVMESHGIRRLSMEETFRLGGGLVRFGIELNKLYLGVELKKRSRMSTTIWNALCKEGLKQKAKPSEWCGTLNAIPVDDLVVEVMSDDYAWIKISAM